MNEKMEGLLLQARLRIKYWEGVVEGLLKAAQITDGCDRLSTEASPEAPGNDPGTPGQTGGSGGGGGELSG